MTSLPTQPSPESPSWSLPHLPCRSLPPEYTTPPLKLPPRPPLPPGAPLTPPGLKIPRWRSCSSSISSIPNAYSNIHTVDAASASMPAYTVASMVPPVLSVPSAAVTHT
ncbi:hypothetical protein E2C01_037921 [Portunus trituberculatus]|uniref:Uncharacterized protein n=1 Tax=Portunus trituberculatus TaxID=210409 RepID=A0A5B7FGK3_PORTR|nr:hypothetical protein [Portunus trituberculatus]